MWSAAVFEPAFPGRSRTASALPGALRAVVDEGRQRVMAVGLLPGGHGLLLLRVRGHDRRVEIDRDQGAAQPGAASPARSQARARAAARAERMAFRARGASAAKRPTSRETIGSEATGPNSSGCERSIATSARQSPPSASATVRSVRIFPGPCTAQGLGATVPALRPGRGPGP